MKFPIRALIVSCTLALAGLPGLNAADVDVFGGFSVAKMKPAADINSSTVNGWNSSVTAYATSRFGITADFAGLYGDVYTTNNNTDKINTHQYSFMAGPQVRLLNNSHFATSIRAVVGGAYGYVPGTSANPLDQSTFAALVGSNFDLKVSRRVSLRVSPGMYITRYGTDQTQKNLRFSVGPVFHFGGES